VKISDKADRSFRYKFAKSVIYKRKASIEEIEYAIQLLAPLFSYRSIGMIERLKRKLKGLSIKWEDMENHENR